MFEKRHHPLLPLADFIRRLGWYFAVAVAFVIASLAIGMAGYRYFEGQSWPDAFLNSAMLLGAMGPVGSPTTTGGKIFAGCYALYCGLGAIFVLALLATPIAHRLLHVFHADPDDAARDGGDPSRDPRDPRQATRSLESNRIIESS
jgi:hypothetical protein